MPNCLADNIIGHSCGPYVLLRDRRLYLFLYCEHFSETRRPTGQPVGPSPSLDSSPPELDHHTDRPGVFFIIFSILVPGSGRF